MNYRNIINIKMLTSVCDAHKNKQQQQQWQKNDWYSTAVLKIGKSF